MLLELNGLRARPARQRVREGGAPGEGAGRMGWGVVEGVEPVVGLNKVRVCVCARAYRRAPNEFTP